MHQCCVLSQRWLRRETPRAGAARSTSPAPLRCSFPQVDAMFERAWVPGLGTNGGRDRRTLRHPTAAERPAPRDRKGLCGSGGQGADGARSVGPSPLAHLGFQAGLCAFRARRVRADEAMRLAHGHTWGAVPAPRLPLEGRAAPRSSTDGQRHAHAAHVTDAPSPTARCPARQKHNARPRKPTRCAFSTNGTKKVPILARPSDTDSGLGV
jgi:hypothetical protein